MNPAADPELTALLHSVVVHFRLGMAGGGNDALVQLIDLILAKLQGGLFGHVSVDELSALLGEILAAQQRHDDLYLADLLQYRLAPLLAPPQPR